MKTIADTQPIRRTPEATLTITTAERTGIDQYTYQIGSTVYTPAGYMWYDTGCVITAYMFLGYTQVGEMKIDFGDGHTGLAAYSYGLGGGYASHSYKAPGTYQIVGTSINSLGERVSVRKQIHVRQRLIPIVSPYNVVVAEA